MPESRLEYKRAFYLQNIADVKTRWYQIDAFRDRLIFLFLTVWFGTIAVYLSSETKPISTNMLMILLLTVTAVFFYLEDHYGNISQFRIRRISLMEDWITTATDSEIESMPGPLSELPVLKKSNLNDVQVNKIWTKPFNKLYLLFLILSVFVKVVLDLFKTTTCALCHC